MFQPSAPRPKTTAAATTSTVERVQRTDEDNRPAGGDEADLDERSHLRARAAAGLAPAPGEASHHGRDVDREVRDRGSQLRVTRRADGRGTMYASSADSTTM